MKDKVSAMLLVRTVFSYILAPVLWKGWGRAAPFPFGSGQAGRC